MSNCIGAGGGRDTEPCSGLRFLLDESKRNVADTVSDGLCESMRSADSHEDRGVSIMMRTVKAACVASLTLLAGVPALGQAPPPPADELPLSIALKWAHATQAACKAK